MEIETQTESRKKIYRKIFITLTLVSITSFASIYYYFTNKNPTKTNSLLITTISDEIEKLAEQTIVKEAHDTSAIKINVDELVMNHLKISDNLFLFRCENKNYTSQVILNEIDVLEQIFPAEFMEIVCDSDLVEENKKLVIDDIVTKFADVFKNMKKFEHEDFDKRYFDKNGLLCIKFFNDWFKIFDKYNSKKQQMIERYKGLVKKLKNDENVKFLIVSCKKDKIIFYSIENSSDVLIYTYDLMEFLNVEILVKYRNWDKLTVVYEKDAKRFSLKKKVPLQKPKKDVITPDTPDAPPEPIMPPNKPSVPQTDDDSHEILKLMEKENTDYYNILTNNIETDFPDQTKIPKADVKIYVEFFLNNLNSTGLINQCKTIAKKLADWIPGRPKIIAELYPAIIDHTEEDLKKFLIDKVQENKILGKYMLFFAIEMFRLEFYNKETQSEQKCLEMIDNWDNQQYLHKLVSYFETKRDLYGSLKDKCASHKNSNQKFILKKEREVKIPKVVSNLNKTINDLNNSQINRLFVYYEHVQHLCMACLDFLKQFEDTHGKLKNIYGDSTNFQEISVIACNLIFIGTKMAEGNENELKSIVPLIKSQTTEAALKLILFSMIYIFDDNFETSDEFVFKEEKDFLNQI